MIFDKKKPLVAYTVERCESCHGESRRLFREGDSLFSETACPSCKGVLRIEMIFGDASVP